MAKKKYDFSGYATKIDLKCSDGRTIRKDAFKHMDGKVVPLVWGHLSNDPKNILGNALLEHRADGTYAYCSFNETENAKDAKELVKHGDIKAMSIHANELKQNGKDVIHGSIIEVSLVMKGANPEAFIDNLEILHGDSYQPLETEALIYTGLQLSPDDVEFEHADKTPAAGGSANTVEQVFNSFTDEQKDVVYALTTDAVEKALAAAGIKQSVGGTEGLENKKDDGITHSGEGGTETMKVNVFDQQGAAENKAKTLTHAQFETILADAQKCGSFKEGILMHAVEYGIENIDILFPDARALSSDPDWLKREDDWVQGVLNGTRHSPFSRIKSVIADMDIDTARAKGYVKATEKKEVYLSASKRTTTPTTIYVKQKLDRDDIIDVTDFDTVAMVRFQLRTLLDEELAQAFLIGDGRELDDDNKIPEANIRPIWTDVDLYAPKVVLTTKTDFKKMIKEIAFSGKGYKGSGSPALYTTNAIHMGMLWVEDENGRRIYESDSTLCAALGVSRIVEIDRLEGKVRTTAEGQPNRELIAIKVNLKDYNVGADKGGQVATFDDFDIDFNQYKYLMETRCSGALVKPKSAQIFEFEVAAG